MTDPAMPIPHVLVVEARFYDDLSDALLKGARAALEAGGASHEVITVPGALELPAAIRLAADSGRFDGFVALGCVWRGETSHYDLVCNESARGLQDLAFKDRLAIGNGVITVDTGEQAWERADPARLDKGGFAAKACLTMIALKRRFGVGR